MSRRERLEEDVRMAKERIDNAPSDTPGDIRDIWEKEYIQLSFDLNNFVDEDDNNDDD